MTESMPDEKRQNPDALGRFTSPEAYHAYLKAREADGEPAYVSQAFIRAMNATAREMALLDEAMDTPLDGSDEDAQAYRLAFIQRVKEGHDALADREAVIARLTQEREKAEAQLASLVVRLRLLRDRWAASGNERLFARELDWVFTPREPMS